MVHLGNAIQSFSSFSLSEEYSGRILGLMNLPILAAILVIVTAAIYLIMRLRKKNIAHDETWGCGTELEEQMQYSSVGFTEPLVKVFHPLYNDMAEITDEEEGTSKRFSMRDIEPFVSYLYEPIGRTAIKISRFIGRMQNGNVQTYLGYILITLVVLLLVVGAL
jgi:hydrogenase-4 component B